MWGCLKATDISQLETEAAPIQMADKILYVTSLLQWNEKYPHVKSRIAMGKEHPKRCSKMKYDFTLVPFSDVGRKLQAFSHPSHTDE